MYADDYSQESCGCNGGASGGAGGLGFIPIATIIGGAIDLARTLKGGSKFTSCPGQMSGYDLGNLLASLTPSELAQLDAAVRATKPGDWYRPGFQGVDLDTFAWAIAGGGDCKVTTTAGKALNTLLAQLKAAHPEAFGVASAFPTTTGPQPVDGGPVSGPIYTTMPVPGPVLQPTTTTAPALPGPVLVQPTAPVLQAGAPSLPASSSWLDTIGDAIKNAGKEAAEAAARSVVGSTYANLPPNLQTQVNQQVGRSVFDEYKLPIMVGGGLLLALAFTGGLGGGRRR